MWRSVVRLAVVAVAFGAGTAHAKTYKLTLEQALALARERSPDVRVEQARVGEARAERAGAEVLLRENPELEVAAGRRSGPDSSSTELEASVSQMFEIGRRGARVAAADAGVARARLLALDARRRAELRVAVAFHRAVYARERVALARAGARSAEAAQAAVEARVRSGDLAALDLNLARTATVRATAAVGFAEAEEAAALGELAAAAGVDPADQIEVTGDLSPKPAPAVADLVDRARKRGDVRALASEERAGRAEERLGAAMRWPEIGLRGSFAREGEEDVLLGGIVLRLPLFERGQEQRARGRARASRAAIERAGLERSVERSIRGAHARYERLLAATRTLQAQAMPIVSDSETLLARSLETGLIALGDYLVARRELLEARAEVLERLLEVAIAGAELELTAGGVP